MIDIDAIKEAIDTFTKSDPEEKYEIHIPSRKGKKRNYLGLSGLGDDCLRRTWYGHRQVLPVVFPPRMLRLFRRGDREEFLFIFLIRGIGATVHAVDENGKQFSVKDFDGHVSGHFDGVIELPREFWVRGVDPFPLLGEYKTYNDKRFQELKKNGVRLSSKKYFVQMQTYMGYEGLKAALFCAVNKNDDELYFEYVPFDPSAFEQAVDDAEKVLKTTGVENAPAKLSEIPSFWMCKFCDFASVCHKGAPALKSCRSCRFARPAAGGEWTCTKGGTYGELCDKYSDLTKPHTEPDRKRSRKLLD